MDVIVAISCRYNQISKVLLENDDALIVVKQQSIRIIGGND